MTAVLPDVVPAGVTVLVLAVRPPGAVRVTVVLTDAGPDVIETGFLDAADCLSRIAEDVLVMLLLPAAGLDVIALPEVLDVLFIGRLLTDEPPLRELFPAKTLSEPVLCLVPLYT